MHPRQSKRIQWLFFCITLALVLLGWMHVFRKPAQGTPNQYLLTGKTMGTTYSIRFFTPPDAPPPPELEALVNQELARINHIMSPYDPQSEISAFNQSRATHDIALSDDLDTVMTLALEIARKTNGAFDPTVAALVNLWGFGTDGRITEPPSPDAVAAAMHLCGHHHLTHANQQLRKDLPDLRLDLSAIAKGYGVDLIARLLRQQNISHFVVEIGGETIASGTKPGGALWRIGIQRPRFPSEAGGEALAGVLELTDRAVATSGDYQNFFTDASGQTYSHILDPRTGRPVGHATAGVTVIAPTCALADALATGLYVMGPDEGLALIETIPDIEALFILREPDGSFRERASSGFPRITH